MDVSLRQLEGGAKAVERGFSTWSKEKGLETNSLLLQAIVEYKDLENIVLQAIDCYVAQYGRQCQASPSVPRLYGQRHLATDMSRCR